MYVKWRATIQGMLDTHHVYCSILQGVVVCCYVLWCAAVCCCTDVMVHSEANERSKLSVLQCVAVCCSVWQCLAVRRRVLKSAAVRCSHDLMVYHEAKELSKLRPTRTPVTLTHHSSPEATSELHVCVCVYIRVCV